jgi:hypothetical protein
MDNKVDPWELLAELREYFGSCGGIPDHLWDITDAALAEHQNAATDVVEPDPWWSIAQQRANEGRYEMIVWRRSLTEWCWDIYIFGQLSAANGVVATEAEAKSSAIKAARSLK